MGWINTIIWGKQASFLPEPQHFCIGFTDWTWPARIKLFK